MPVGERPFGVTISADGRRAYTANVGSNDVSVIDIAGRTVIATIPVGRRPYAVALSGGRGFVTNQYANTLSVIDTGTLKVVKTLAVGTIRRAMQRTRRVHTSMLRAGSTTF